MPEEPSNTMADYESQIEQHEFIKRQGIEAYADMLCEILGDKVDEDKKILVKQGLTEMMAGPPRMRMPCPPAQFGPQIDAEFLEIPSPIFEEKDERNGVTRVWDWASIAAGSTHAERGANVVHLYNYDELLISLTDEAARQFWIWQELMRKYTASGQPVMIRSGRARHRRPRSTSSGARSV
jgi:hypothetical protein